MTRRQALALVSLAALTAAPSLGAAEEMSEEEKARLAEALEEEYVPPPPPPEIEFGTTVTARRFDEDVFTSGRSVDVVEPRDLAEALPPTVPGALARVPGVMVQRTNAAGGAPYLRGMVGPQNLVLVDGIRLNNSTWRTGPLQYLNTVDPWTLERIEVVRGPGSVLYGSDALGGVLQLISKSPRTLGGGQLAVEPAGAIRGASADRSWNARIGLGAMYAGYGVLGGGSMKQFGDLRGGGDTGVQPFSGYHEWDADVKLRVEPIDGLDVTGAFSTVHVSDAGRFDHPDDPPADRKATFYDNTRELGYLQAAGRLPCIDTQLKLSLSIQRTTEMQTKRNVPGDDLRFAGTPSTKHDEVHTLGVFGTGTTRLLDEDLVLTYGVEHYHDWVESDAHFSDGSSYDLFGVYLLGEYRFAEVGPGDIKLFVGDRLSWTGADAPDVPVVGDVSYSKIGNVNSAGVQYVWPDTLNVALTWSQGFRAPNLQETTQVGDTGEFFEIPNGTLGPERSDTLELLVRAKVWQLGISAAYYVSLLRDAIVREDATWEGQAEIEGKKVKRRVNANQGRIHGIEVGLRLEPWRFLALTAHGTWTHGTVIDDGESSPMRRIPPFFGLASLKLRDPGGGLFGEVYVQGALEQTRLSGGDKDDSRIGPDGTPAWWTLNLSAGYALNQRNRLVLIAENILDERYKTHGSGVYSAGLNVSLLLQLAY